MKMRNSRRSAGFQPAVSQGFQPAGLSAPYHAWRITFFILSLFAILPTHAAVRNQDANAPRQAYNDGTQKLREGKLREAEGYLQNAVASQDEKVQPAALYNLGHARFQQGVQELKGGPNAKSTASSSQAATARGDEAIRSADEALAGSDLGAILAAYMRGRGSRKEMKAAAEAVKRALDSYGTVLMKWQRASGDFKSAHELRTADTDALHNAEVVDRSIARLVDSQQLMMDGEKSLRKRREQLKQKMGELKKRMPKEMQQQCQNGEEEDEEEEGEKDKEPKEPKPGQEEPKPREGEARLLTPEEALRLLDMLRLDANRKLPLGAEDTGAAKDKKRRDW